MMASITELSTRTSGSGRPTSSCPTQAVTGVQKRRQHRLPVANRIAAEIAKPCLACYAATERHQPQPALSANQVESSKAAVLPTLQAEVFWLREQLDRERSKANTTHTVTPADTRRLALETAQKQREVSSLQTQVASLRQHLLEAEATLHSQTADLALCKRAQLQHDWLMYADTRKRLLDSMAETDDANSKANITAKALKQEQQERAVLEERLSGLQHKLQGYEGEAAAATTAAAEANAKLRAGPPGSPAESLLLGSLFSLGAMFASSTEQLSALPSLKDVHLPQLFPSSKQTSDRRMK
ncbi:hypothetical protein WJX74_000987 [Apatococcus lobatus]|uniref:Uncharacterized protein n=1 Tax=Apatococcus lobatus TaxID=904363 RepID=A0AAW1RT29_9CHLO